MRKTIAKKLKQLAIAETGNSKSLLRQTTKGTILYGPGVHRSYKDLKKHYRKYRPELG